MLRIAFYGDDIDGLRLVGVHVDAKPKSLGKSPLTSCQESPPSSLRMTSQCFCMKSTSGRDGCTGDLVDAVARLRRQGRGYTPPDRRPLLAGRQIWPASSLRNTPAAEMATTILAGSPGPRMIVCRQRPPAPGCHAGPVGWPPQPRQLLPGLAGVGGTEQGRVLSAGVHRGGVVERGLQVPDPGELPGPGRAVVPQVRPHLALVSEVVAHGRPGLARRRPSAA